MPLKPVYNIIYSINSLIWPYIELRRFSEIKTIILYTKAKHTVVASILITQLNDYSNNNNKKNNNNYVINVCKF